MTEQQQQHPITPNDLSHLSDDEFNALCPQGEHAPGSEPLSPAALAVWEAFNQDEAGVFVDYGDKLAAALRAAADQVVPEYREHYPATFDERHRKVSAFDVRHRILAIAGALEAQ